VLRCLPATCCSGVIVLERDAATEAKECGNEVPQAGTLVKPGELAPERTPPLDSTPLQTPIG